jgi:hypothetical protein
MLLSYHLTATKKQYFQPLFFPHTITFITNFPIKISNLNTKPFSVVTSFRSSAMSQISNSQFARLMLQHFGAAKTPAYISVSRAQRVSLKSIFDTKGSSADVCAVLNLPLPAAAVPLPAAAGFSAAVAAVAVLPSQVEVPAANNVQSEVEECVPVVASDSSPSAASATEVVVAVAVPPSQVEVPAANNVPSEVEASAVDASGSSPSAASPTAVLNEPQRHLSQAPATTGKGGAVSQSARVAPPLASAAARNSIKRSYQPSSIHFPVIIGGA